MMILDANGLINCIKSGKALPSSELLVTDDLREEYETALLINGHLTLNMVDASSLPQYNEAFYYKEYTKYLNSFSSVNVASMRSLTDVSILALVSCMVNQFGKGQQIRLDLGDEREEKIIVLTDDKNLTRRLQADFSDRVEVIGLSSLQ